VIFLATFYEASLSMTRTFSNISLLPSSYSLRLLPWEFADGECLEIFKEQYLLAWHGNRPTIQSFSFLLVCTIQLIVIFEII